MVSKTYKYDLDGKKIYVAGHKGMAGSAIWRRLEKEQSVSLIGKSRSELDLLDTNAVDQAMREISPDVLVIAAAKVGGILANKTFPVEFLFENMQIQNNLLKAAHEANVEKVLFLGSSCIYPKFAKQPIKETELLTGELEPTNEPYALAKIAGLKLVNAYRSEYGHDWISIMPTNLYGPGDNYDLSSSHVLPALIAKFINAKSENAKSVSVWGTGRPRREFMHIDDLADAVVFLLKSYNEDVAINVGTGKDVSISDLALMIKEITEFPGEIKFNDTMPDGTPRKLLDVTKLRNLGWEASIELEHGLRTTIQQYTDNLTKVNG
jgi:GDP-L-fucose synthase